MKRLELGKSSREDSFQELSRIYYFGQPKKKTEDKNEKNKSIHKNTSTCVDCRGLRSQVNFAEGHLLFFGKKKKTNSFFFFGKKKTNSFWRPLELWNSFSLGSEYRPFTFSFILGPEQINSAINQPNFWILYIFFFRQVIYKKITNWS